MAFYPIPDGRKSNYDNLMKNNTFPSFQEALQRHLSEHGDDITSLSKRAGVSRDALYKVHYGKTKSPSLEVVVKVAQAYDETVEEFMGLAEAELSSELESLLSRLSPSEQEILRASIQALVANRDP